MIKFNDRIRRKEERFKDNTNVVSIIGKILTKILFEANKTPKRSPLNISYSEKKKMNRKEKYQKIYLLLQHQRELVFIKEKLERLKEKNIRLGKKGRLYAFSNIQLKIQIGYNRKVDLENRIKKLKGEIE